MAKIIEDVSMQAASTTLSEQPSSARYIAPELIEPGPSAPTTAADVYSFAMAIYELLTGRQPYFHLKRDAQVLVSRPSVNIVCSLCLMSRIRAVIDAKIKPARPVLTVVADEMWLQQGTWQVLLDSWEYQPSSRPTMRMVSDRITHAAAGHA